MSFKFFQAMLTFALIPPTAGQAFDLSWDSAGVRQGTTRKRQEDAFYQTEAYLHWKLPWRWDYESGWSIGTRLDLTAGALLHREVVGFVGTFGPSATFKYKDHPLYVDVGCNPTLLSRDEFDFTDFGIPFQFTTHGSLVWDLGEHFELSYRFQHMSNASISAHNPGLNLHFIGFGYRF